MRFDCPHCNNRVYLSATSSPSDPRTRTPDPRAQYAVRGAVFADQGPRIKLLLNDGAGLEIPNEGGIIIRKANTLMPRTTLYDAYYAWAAAQDGPILRRADFYMLMRNLGFKESRDSTDRYFDELGVRSFGPDA